MTAAYLLAQLPPLLPPDVVQRLAASTLPREHDVLVPMLARHGAPAAALVPLCLELLENEPLPDDESWNSRHLRWDRATTALAALIDVVDPIARVGRRSARRSLRARSQRTMTSSPLYMSPWSSDDHG